MVERLQTHSPTRIEISLADFAENIRTIKQYIHHPSLMAVVKTDAYGHGIVVMGKVALRAGANRLGVTAVEEGALLRENGVKAPIHLLSSVSPNRAADIVRLKLTASISSAPLARALSREAVRQGLIVNVHLKVDTGLHRFGISPNEAVELMRDCYYLPGIHWEGIYTHFSSADEGDWKTTGKQFALFRDTVQRLVGEGYTFPVHHVGGSTIMIERPDMHLDMVRPGIALFGYPPEPRQNKLITLKPVMALKSQVLQVRQIPANTPVGYGGSYVTKTKETIAVIPVGHGDGYKRILSNKGEMLIRGQRAKICGIISLDQTIVNVTDIPGITEGDEVVLLGHQGDDTITAREIAVWMDSIVDEVLASLMSRVRRIYL